MLFKGFKLIFYLSVLYAIYLLILLSIPYLTLEPNIDFLTTKQYVYHIKSWKWSFYLHVFSSSFIIFSGLFQFNRWTINKHPRIHKTLGYIYISLLLLISGPAGLIMSLYANGGIYAQISFVSLSLCWILFTLIAFILVLQRKYVQHGKWLLRSYALTLSAVTLRLYLMLIHYFNVDINPIDSYILVAYLSWVPNLIVAEIMIQRNFVEKLMMK